MVDPRFIEESDVGALDARPNLMELTPKEFEALISNLFEKMRHRRRGPTPTPTTPHEGPPLSSVGVSSRLSPEKGRSSAPRVARDASVHAGLRGARKMRVRRQATLRAGESET